MSSCIRNPKTEVIQAAGGLVWRDSQRGKEIAVVHRRCYDDWSLPKGKVNIGESWEGAAIREVKEETNCDVSLGDFAGCSCYPVKGRPKIVLFWHMTLTDEQPFEPNSETDQLLWLTVEEALAKLSYSNERALLEDD
jgi:ADP-ribose pyrophosphatase YjhB (NUDIX family)